MSIHTTIFYETDVSTYNYFKDITQIFILEFQGLFLTLFIAYGKPGCIINQHLSCDIHLKVEKIQIQHWRWPLQPKFFILPSSEYLDGKNMKYGNTYLGEVICFYDQNSPRIVIRILEWFWWNLFFWSFLWRKYENTN